MNSILDNPIAYAIMTALEKIRRERYPQFFITAAYITCANEYPLLPIVEGNDFHNHMEAQATQQKRAELFRGMLLGYDMAVGKKSITKIIEDDHARRQ